MAVQSSAREVFNDLCSKFLVISRQIDITDRLDEYYHNQLNVLLNELNSQDYKALQVADSFVCK